MPSPLIPKVSLIILNWNGKEDTIACLESLQKLSYPHVDIILVDNGSTDATVPLIQERFPYVHCIPLPDNLGFAGGNNPGIQYALKKGADYILLLNNDTLVAPDLIESFLTAFSTHPQAGIIGAHIYLFDEKDRLDHLGGMWIKKQANLRMVGFREKQIEPPPAHCIPLDYVCGACIMIKRSVIETIGMLESRYFLYWEDTDFCFRAARAGFEILSCPAAKIWHKVSASVVGGKAHGSYFWWRGRLLTIDRHCTSKEKRRLYLQVIFPQIYKIVRNIFLRTFQLMLLRLFLPHKDHSHRRSQLHRIHAEFRGIKDYFLKRFDKGPSWIYKSKK